MEFDAARYNEKKCITKYCQQRAIDGVIVEN